MVALGENVGQPDRGDPAPAQSLLEPMAIQQIGQLDLQHDMEEQDQVIDALRW